MQFPERRLVGVEGQSLKRRAFESPAANPEGKNQDVERKA